MKGIRIDELIVRSSIQILLANRSDMRPEDYGTGCILRYKEKNYLFTVSHIITQEGLILFLETNLPPDSKRGTLLKPVGGVITFKKFKIKDRFSTENFEQLLNNGRPVDIAFAEIKEFSGLLQPAIDFGAFKVEASTKVSLYLEDAVRPSKKELYAFFGRVKHKYVENGEGKLPSLAVTNTLKYNLKYNGKKGEFYEFLSPDIISDKGDYQGCSGAPVIDSKGRIVGLVCAIFVPSHIIQVIPMKECQKLLEYALQTNML